MGYFLEFREYGVVFCVGINCVELGKVVEWVKCIYLGVFWFV